MSAADRLRRLWLWPTSLTWPSSSLSSSASSSQVPLRVGKHEWLSIVLCCNCFNSTWGCQYRLVHVNQIMKCHGSFLKCLSFFGLYCVHTGRLFVCTPGCIKKMETDVECGHSRKTSCAKSINMYTWHDKDSFVHALLFLVGNKS